jgi:hypothetical protein
MDRQEAKLILQALRPTDLNSSEPTVIQALILVESDPELKAWWEAEKSFDNKVAAKLEEVPLPPHLRATILAGRKIEHITPQPQLSYWLAAAALVAILCVAGTFQQIATSTSPLAQMEYDDAMLPLLNHDAPELGMTSPDHDKIMAWLKERNAPMGTLPARMTALTTLGCQKFVMHGHPVSLICFALAGGGLAHLFIVDRQALSNPPGDTAPEFNQIQGWSTAAWSDGRMTYLLATRAGSDALKQLL